MNQHRHFWVASLSLLAGLLLAMGSCGGSKSSGNAAGTSTGGASGAGGAGAAHGGSGGSISLSGGGGGQTALAITPMNASLVVTVGSPVPTQQLTALYDGAKTTAAWTVDRGEIGTIGAATGVFTPTGNVAGVVNVTAAADGLTATTTLTVSIKSTQNGALPGDNPTMTVGTVGDGVGGPVDMPTQMLLDGTPTADPAFTLLYPYDQTVWPRGLLAPLLQWTPPAANPTAIHVRLKSAYFQYDGFFSTPPNLPANGAFVRHPIPQQAWQQATDSVDSVSGTDALVMTIVVASGTTASGPLTETWKVAPGRLAGTVYYNSYGTALATQISGALPDGHYFGGAVLGIAGSSLGPTLVSGSTSNGSQSGCRVCHVGSADGTRLLVATGDDYASAVSVDLTQPTYPETATGDNLVFSGLYPDGSMAMRTGGPAWDGSQPGYAAAGPSVLLTVPAAAAVTTSGFSTLVTQAATPAFSHDGATLAFNFLSGPGNPPSLPAGNGSQLGAMSFDKATGAFTAPQVLYTAPSGRTPGWPAFLPTDTGVIFDNEVVAPDASTFTNVHAGTVFLGTSLGARSELWWVDRASGMAYPLNQLNGRSKDGTTLYLPQGPNNHGLDTQGGGPPGDDSTLSFEASTSPVVAGGYIWVIFTSRRMFGNVATVNPWWSDPRDHDISQSPTPKKLWVAAIDLNAKPGSDPSHPAFYLPAQELLAGNSRGFWVLDPCQQNGASCQTGDQCCGGFCQPSGPTQALTCGSSTAMCAGLQEKCATASDCCTTGAVCVNGFCALSPAQ
jgi:hypothetical protein